MTFDLSPLVPPAGRAPGPNEPCWCGSGKKYKRCHQQADRQTRTAAAMGSPAHAATRKPLRPGKVGPRRAVPPHIPRPDYADAGKPSQATGSEIKSPEQIERMRRACRAAALVLRKTAEAVREWITTDELDGLAHEECIRLGGYPSPLNYYGFPKSICTSLNEVICHGIPDSRPLEQGDIVNLDVTVFLEGVHGDCSATYCVGEVDEESKRLVKAAQECLEVGIAAARPGQPIHAVGRAIERHADRYGFGVVRAYCGHGIGERFHSSLQVPHYYDSGFSWIIEPGMTFTVEPMITVGSWDYRLWNDGWTAVTADGERTAQFEHTLLITEAGPEILTLA
jgi:methionyl aminopeptidase